MACASACPRKLIVSVPASKKVHVACANQDKGKAAMSVCTHSCIGCGLCQKECKKDAIHVVNGVAVIDYDKCVGCKSCMRIGCPAISMKEGKAHVDNTLCVGCGVCEQMCAFGAFQSTEKEG